MSKLESVIKQFEKAIGRLEEALSMPKTDIVRDSAIQRFEFTLDLSWKMVKAFLEEKKGIVCTSPKGCFREAYRQGVIGYEEDWLKLVDMRNETVNEEIAERICSELPNALKHFMALLALVKNG